MRYLVIAILIMLTTNIKVDAAPIFPNSVVSNDIEFIKTSDPDVFSCIQYHGQQRAEMPDKRRDELFDNTSFKYIAHYKDGSSVSLFAHSDFGSKHAALKSIKPVAKAIGKLPTIMRSKLNHVIIHKGDETAFAESEGHFFILYSENIHTRILNHDLEETIFHESVHATLDSTYLNSVEWLHAQKSDGRFITEYAQSVHEKEDMAESALFAWTILNYPSRLSKDLEAKVKEIMPHRLSFFKNIFLKNPAFYPIGPEQKCK